ncbi:MAG: hypothetical protein SFW09_24185 [Hyphomicrobiaceae bacterium]|nr:hypothetical protein [Hyphomicrobiaceae bacterium]
MRTRAISIGQPTGLALVAAALLAAGSCAAMAQAPATPPSPTEVSEGREIAAKLCSNCHATDPAATDIKRADVPTFHAIANGPHGSRERLVAAIVLPHPEMPGIPLTRAEIRAIVDYIVSLRAKP